jgi:glycosyltransferase involved in cell wall biosynthesis
MRHFSEIGIYEDNPEKRSRNEDPEQQTTRPADTVGHTAMLTRSRSKPSALCVTMAPLVTAVHQLLPAAAPRDAITGQAFSWRDLLHGWGYESEIVAEHVQPDLTGAVHRLNRAGKRLLNKGGLILRYAIWSETVESALRAKGPIALCYHNITPGELLRDFNPSIADLCDRGRDELPLFQGRIDTLIADSSFNAADLRDAGLGEATVIPLLLELPAEVPRRDPNREPIVLTVGRIVPNKRLEDVVKSFALYQRHHAPDGSLLVVGSDVGFENYRAALDLLVARVGARRVFFTGPISSKARDAWYRRADVYLSMSVHEGFCAPLIEALAHGVPVVARRAGAVPETLAGAGLVLDGVDLPLIAEAIHELASSQSTREALFDSADQRLANLRPEVLAPRIRSALAPLLAH